MTEKTKIETAIDYIAQHGSARTPEIAKTLGITEKNVRSMLDPAIRTGYLVTCQVEKHTPDGVRRMSEYRLSATISESKVSWKDFRVKAAGSAPKEAAPPITTTTPKPDTLAEAVCLAMPPAVPIEQPDRQATPPVVQADKSLFLLGSDGCLRIEAAGITFELNRDETRHLGLFLAGSCEFWRYHNANA